MKVSSSHCLKCTGVHSYTRRNSVFFSCDAGWMSLSVCSPSPVSLETLAVFLYKEFYLHLALLLRLFYTFYCFYFIVYFSADSSGCDVCGLEGGICLQSIYCLFICTGLSPPEVRRPLSLELQSRLWDPAPPSLKRVPPLEFLSCQHCTLTFSCFLWELLSTQLLKWLQFVIIQN